MWSDRSSLWGIAAGAAIFIAVSWLTLPSTGRLFVVRPVNPDTGAVILDNPAAANAASSSQKFDTASFDPDQLVASMWDNRIKPYIDEHATDVGELLTALRQDPEVAQEKYGVSPGTSAGYSFPVQGAGKVTAVDTSTPVGKLTVRVPDGSGNGSTRTVTVLVGPLVIANSLRDALPFITLNDFTNQVQYSNISEALNKKAIEAAVSDKSPKALKGEEIAFVGAFSLKDGEQDINVVPVRLTVGG